MTGGVDLAGWRPYVTIWRGEQFNTERGDPAYFAGNFTEFGMLKDVDLPGRFPRCGSADSAASSTSG
ncbi:MAG: hypothetical protein U0361_17165 [Nitrospiraceae bacterium]